MYNFVTKEPKHIFIISAEYITSQFSSVSNIKENLKKTKRWKQLWNDVW